MKKLRYIILVLAIFTFQLMADQAAYISKDKALEVSKMLKKMDKIKLFCAPCGDEKAQTIKVNSVKAQYTDYENFWEVVVNKSEHIDLAYTYVLENGKWRNLAYILKVPVKDVPEFIK